MPIGESISVIKLAESLLDKVLTKKGTRIAKKINAVKLMRRAINNTEAYLIKTGHNYSPNEQLSNLWNDAFEAMVPIDKDLAWRLDDKSRFWSNPQRWIQNEGSMELVPSLNELDEKCELLLVELDKRK
ncbi:MAG: hypothetical protein ABNG98_00470 [Flavobacterium sp.]|jgi:hypothetical protein